MNNRHVIFSIIPFLLAGCFSADTGNSIVSQKFVHKYGFDVSPQEWTARAQDGQIVATLKNGVKITSSYENGVLHGPTTHTFPNSSVVEKLELYDHGILLKEVAHDADGIPMREEVYEFDNRKIITLWDPKGAPISIEEYKGDLLLEGKYFNPSHDLEGQVAQGNGERVKRDREGLLILRDSFEKGNMVSRTSFHPNGQVHTISHYSDLSLDGEQLKFTASGKPLMKLHWNHGVLDGIKTVYRNGIKVAEIPYVNGQKHGLETHCDDLGNLTAEIEWKQDKKHGSSKLHSEEATEEDWFYKGQAVSHQSFDMLSNRDQLVAELSIE
ncbi:MAG TPA: toxin-antitoxin system YwqK family antitoxin [Chlamydiales bacterium]